MHEDRHCNFYGVVSDLMCVEVMMMVMLPILLRQNKLYTWTQKSHHLFRLVDQFHYFGNSLECRSVVVSLNKLLVGNWKEESHE